MAEETNTTVTETNTAENSGGDPQGGTDNNVNAVSTNDGAEKTFTQKELDDIVKQRLSRATRLKLGKVFYGNGEGMLGFIYDSGEERSIKCRFESITAALTARSGTMQVSLLCGDPYFIKDGTPVLICGGSGLWEFDNWELPEDDLFEFDKLSTGASAAVDNDGETDAGCIIRIEVGSSVSGIKIKKAQSSEYIALRGEFSAGDIITIDTRQRRTAIRLSSKTSTEEKDIMSRLIWGSIFFSVPRGGCRISAETDNGLDMLNVTLQIDERYRGI